MPFYLVMVIKKEKKTLSKTVDIMVELNFKHDFLQRLYHSTTFDV